MIYPSIERLPNSDKRLIVDDLLSRIGKDVESLSFVVDTDDEVRNIDVKFCPPPRRCV